MEPPSQPEKGWMSKKIENLFLVLQDIHSELLMISCAYQIIN